MITQATPIPSANSYSRRTIALSPVLAFLLLAPAPAYADGGALPPSGAIFFSIIGLLGAAPLAIPALFWALLKVGQREEGRGLTWTTVALIAFGTSASATGMFHLWCWLLGDYPWLPRPDIVVSAASAVRGLPWTLKIFFATKTCVGLPVAISARLALWRVRRISID